MRHLVDRGTIDPEDGISHSVKVAWRALAMLQEELEAAGRHCHEGRGCRMNPNVHELEELLDPGLPAEFTLWVPDAWMAGALRAGLYTGTTRIPPNHKRIIVRSGETLIEIRADASTDAPTIH
jgi:hypothetical protein